MKKVYIKYCLIVIVIYIIIYLYSYLYYLSYYSYCLRNYPTDKFNIRVKSNCRYSPLHYSFTSEDSIYSKTINFTFLKNKIKNSILFFTLVDGNSFKYLLNLYTIYLLPYNIESLLTVVFDKATYELCRKNRIFCIYIRWPLFLFSMKAKYKMKVWLMKYYLFYVFITKNIPFLYIDSDIIFVQNCLDELLNRHEDIVLLKSQSSQIFGNAGIVYI